MDETPPDGKLLAEIGRLKKVINALMDRAERSTKARGSSFNLFETTVMLEEQVRGRTRELEQALDENERITRDLQRVQERMAQEMEERRRVEDRLRQAATVFSSAQNGIVITDTQGRVVAVNPAFTSITGHTEAETLGKNMRLLHAGGQDQAFYQDMWRALRDEGRWQGEIWNLRKDGEPFLEWLTVTAVTNSRGEIVNFIGVFSDITHVERTYQLEQLAHHDVLTGLPNRLLLLSRLEHAIDRARRNGQTGAVLFFDLDRFKHVNDSLGHTAGDELLRGVSARLQEHLRTTDTLARLGGDEFIIVLEELADPEHAATVARSLIEHLHQPFWLGCGQEVYVGASVGISLFPANGETPGQLIQRADTALYQAKDRGRGTFCFYTEAMTRAADVHVRLESRLRRALTRGEFVLHYQPLVSLARYQVRGVEALVRWQCPDEESIAPTQFIALAEDTGLILPLGEWVLRQACGQMKLWLDAGLTLETMSVNLSARQFNQPDLARRLRDILDDTGLPARYLELEITEGSIMEHGQDVIARLSALKSIGARLAIDDFGTGYSSLAYLKRFPIDKLKVDRSFVSDIPDNPADMQITAAVIALGRNLNLEVLAEGVETEAQRSFMADHLCDTCQGFLFSPALPEKEFVDWFAVHQNQP